MITTPLPHIGCGIFLRTESEGDAEFLLRLYLSVRWHEFEAVNWPDEAKLSFLADQFRIQTQQYRACYPGLERWIVAGDAGPIGRLYLLAEKEELRVVDISLLPEWCRRGIGGLLLAQVQSQADLLGVPLRLHVEEHNPALHLYCRLGFYVINKSGVYWLLEWKSSRSSAI